MEIEEDHEKGEEIASFMSQLAELEEERKMKSQLLDDELVKEHQSSILMSEVQALFTQLKSETNSFVAEECKIYGKIELLQAKLQELRATYQSVQIFGREKELSSLSKTKSKEREYFEKTIHQLDAHYKNEAKFFLKNDSNIKEKSKKLLELQALISHQSTTTSFAEEASQLEISLQNLLSSVHQMKVDNKTLMSQFNNLQQLQETSKIKIAVHQRKLERFNMLQEDILSHQIENQELERTVADFEDVLQFASNLDDWDDFQ